MTSKTIERPGFGLITWRLAAKDFWLIRWPLLGYVTLAMLSLILISIESRIAFHAGLVLMVSALAVVGAHLVFASTLHERTNQTLPFMLSLPISFPQYALSKLLFTVGTFSLFWLALAASVFAVVHAQEFLSAGMLPYYLIVLGYLAVAFVLTLAVAMMTESVAWTIVIMSTGNMSISLVMITLAGYPGITEYMADARAVWNSTAIGLLSLEALLIVFLVSLTIFVQSRKSDFL